MAASRQTISFDFISADCKAEGEEKAVESSNGVLQATGERANETFWRGEHMHGCKIASLNEPCSQSPAQAVKLSVATPFSAAQGLDAVGRVGHGIGWEWLVEVVYGVV